MENEVVILNLCKKCGKRCEGKICNLNGKQLKVFEAITKGKNVFMTGPGGTGKSYVIEAISIWAKQNNKKLIKTSTTGVSALLINGRTIHSFLGIGTGDYHVERLVENTRRYKQKCIEEINETDILVIDEISMLSADLFDKINDYLCLIRDNENFFGGIQILLSGGFFQLSPVCGAYCFESTTWKNMKKEKAKFETIELDEQERQKDDDILALLLKDFRVGVCTEKSLKILEEKSSNSYDKENDKKYTVLRSTNEKADKINKKYFQELKSKGAKEHTYYTKYSQNINSRRWANDQGIQDKITLVVGSLVMITRNIDLENGIVNGTKGVIKSFENDGPKIEFEFIERGKERIKKQILLKPFRYKNQFTDDIIRCKKCDVRFADFSLNRDNEIPEFCVFCKPAGSFFVEKIWVDTLPLKLAWAITIHKSQGATIDFVDIILDEENIFAYGQAYVALSRARTLNTVRLRSINKDAFQADPTVLEFYGLV